MSELITLRINKIALSRLIEALVGQQKAITVLQELWAEGKENSDPISLLIRAYTNACKQKKNG